MKISPIKDQILLVHFVYRDVLMTIIDEISDNLIKHFGIYFSIGKILRITQFAIKKRGKDDRGDAK